MKHIKPMMIICVVLWLSLILHIVLLEGLGLTQNDLMPTGIITISLLVVFYCYYFYLYFKNKRKVDKLKQEYLDSLKPTKPLLFCPTDEELEKRYYTAIKEPKRNEKSYTKEENESANEDEIEMS